MAAQLFGTDGIRGRVGEYPILPEFFSRLAAAVEIFFSRLSGKSCLKIAVGRDTRGSGPELVRALIAGFSSAVTVLDCGILPTAAVAHAAHGFGCDCGFSVTASHNPYSDNGIKIFNGSGEKLGVGQELAIGELVQATRHGEISRFPTIVNHAAEAREKFCAMFDSIGTHFDGRVVLDTANGAGTSIGPLILGKFCSDLLLVGNSPNGRNINVGCGSEDVSRLCETVRESGARMGFALDGDGDRLIVVDETGTPLSGDQVIGIFAKYLFDGGQLGNGLVVVTEQSNCGLDSSLAKFGIGVARCAVGDRNVYHAMLERGAMFGGEESGHLILREFSNTGDGILAALFTMKILAECGLPLPLLKSQVSLFPKKLQNIQVNGKVPLAEVEGFGELLDSLKKSEPDYGRVFVRYSGTEGKLRVLVEAKSDPAVDKILTCVCKFLEYRLA